MNNWRRASQKLIHQNCQRLQMLCSGRRADDASIQNPYPQKTNRWDEAGQTTAIVGIPNKHLPCFVLFKLKRTKYA
jgi:hypothetical protein